MGSLSIPKTWRGPVLGTALLATLAIVAVNWESMLSFKRDKDLSPEEMAESAKLRPILAVVAWHMFLDRPLFGCGYGHYPEESLAYLSDRSTDLPLEKARPYIQHNVLLAMLTETGLMGMALFLAVFVLWSADAWRLWHSDSPLWARQAGLLFLAGLGAYLPNAMVHDASVIPMVNMLMFFLAGMSEGAARSQTSPRQSGAEPEIGVARRDQGVLAGVC
jgi:O-antigen ligase